MGVKYEWTDKILGEIVTKKEHLRLLQEHNNL